MTDEEGGQAGVGVGVVVVVRQVDYRAGATSPGVHSNSQTPHQGSSFYQIHC